jgi:hypothetical protein
MKLFISLLPITTLLIACNGEKKVTPPVVIDWGNRIATISADSTPNNSTYLSVYSHIYTVSQERISDLTATISMRNTSITDTLYIFKAEYFDTNGKSVRNYIVKPIFIAPMETAEIIIEQKDNAGGSGANFIFDWKIKPSASEPLFEAIMISTSGQQGLSFTTQGKRIK